ncbi:MAG TPA: ATP synthase F1 subunit epsilon [Actinomycetota bacterium]|nr:ATP synthase F1 subunit epsilon [Actinomycetota bacterium]
MDVSIVSAEREVWRGDADLVVARSPEGEFGIMRGHIPFLAALIPGLVKVSGGTATQTFLVSGGFLEASGPSDDYHVIVLADDAEEVGDIDPAEAARRIEEMRRQKTEDKTGDRSDAALRASLAAGERESGEYSSRH